MSKPWPPKDVSPDGQSCRSFVDAEKHYLEELSRAADPTKFARAEFDRMDKKKLRSVLLLEQGHLCAYCERRVDETDPKPRIDHWRPLSLDHKYALHWSNLYLSCPTPETCDSAKTSRALKSDVGDPELPWPTEFDYERHIAFTSGGEMYVRNDTGLSSSVQQSIQLAIEDQLDGQRVRSSVLNLNHPALIAARRAALDSERNRLERRFPNKTATQTDREARVQALKSVDRLEEFLSVRVCWLEKRIGKGR